MITLKTLFIEKEAIKEKNFRVIMINNFNGFETLFQYY